MFMMFFGLGLSSRYELAREELLDDSSVRLPTDVLRNEQNCTSRRGAIRDNFAYLMGLYNKHPHSNTCSTDASSSLQPQQNGHRVFLLIGHHNAGSRDAQFVCNSHSCIEAEKAPSRHCRTRPETRGGIATK